MEKEHQEEIHQMEKLTITKLREDVMEKYPELTGVHGMEKEELIAAVCKIKGIPYHEKEGESGIAHNKKMRLKKDIKTLRAKKEEIKGEGVNKQREILRRKIKTMKRKLRKVA